MADLERTVSDNLPENHSRKCRKRKSDAQDIFDIGEKSRSMQTEIIASRLPDNNSSQNVASFKKRNKAQLSVDKTNFAQGADAPKHNVSFRDIDVGKSEVEQDLQYERIVRKSKIWKRVLPVFNDEEILADPEDKKSPNLPRVLRPHLTYATAKDLGLKSAIFLKIRSLLLYLLFMFFLIFAAFGNFSTETYFFTEAVSSVLMKNCLYYNSEGQANTFEGISNLADLEGFVGQCFKGGLAKGLWGQVRQDCGVVFLTTPRLRQVRVTNETCLISLYRGVVCYDFFSEAKESVEAFGPGDSSAFVHRRSEDGNLWFRGYYTYYNSNGFSFLISQNQDYAELLRQGWVDGATSAIFIDFTLYSSDSNLFCVVQFLFELPPTGRIKASYTSRAIFLLRYHTRAGHFLLFTEIMLMVLNFMNSVQILINLIYFKYRYFLSIGLNYNFATTVFCWYAVFCLIARYFAVDRFFDTRFRKLHEFVDFQPVLREHVHCDSVIVLACFFASFRLYGFLNFDLMEHLKITLRTCFKNIAVFAIAFAIIVWAFVQVANLLFGHSLERYRTFSRCFSELMKVMLGDLDYEGPSSILSVLGPIFILTYVIFVVFVFINMFFAIINGTFTFVANNVEIEEESYFGFLAHCYRTVRRRGRPLKVEEKKLTNSEKIRNLLLESGFSNTEIRIFFCRYIVDDAQVLDDTVFEGIRNLRIPPGRLEELKALVGELGNAVDLLLSKAEWLARRIRFVKETNFRRKNHITQNIS